MQRRVFLAAMMFALASPPMQAQPAEHLLLGINTGMATQDDQIDLREKYRPLADFISEVTGHPVRLEGSQNLHYSERRLKRDAFDLFLGPPQIIAQAMKQSDYTPLVRYQGKIRSAFVVMESSDINRIADARGKKLGLPDENSLPTHLSLAKLRFSRINPDEYFFQISITINSRMR